MRFFGLAALALLLTSCAAGPEMAPYTTQVIALSGELTRADHQTYKEIPFEVPRGVTSVTVELSYTGKENKTVIDMGLRDPSGPRGWSGGNKAKFTVGEFEATPSYAPGPIQPGTWLLVLGVPNVREGSHDHFDATVTLSSAPVVAKTSVKLSTDRVLSPLPGWRRGDFHMHSAHSDGSCDVGGARGPCPLARTVEAAAAAKLDFAAITDHNTLSQRDPMRDLQGAFPDLLLIPGTEVTTFWGHANAVGLSKPVEFQLGSPRLPTFSALIDEVAVQGAFLSINHPRQPSGEVCMGCGWTAKDTDFSRVSAIEAVNGSGVKGRDAEGAFSGIPFWQERLNEGLRITAIGGSDNHDATDRDGTKQSPVGRPATVVYARELSTKGIIEGVKSGRVFVDVSNTPGATLDMEGRAPGQLVAMGGVLTLGPGEQAHVGVKVAGIAGTVTIVSHGVSAVELNGAPPSSDIIVELDGGPFGWIRADVRDATGKLMLLGNPIYVRAK